MKRKNLGFTLVELPAVSKRAFTLVELLVVIGIIALLISILLPALNKARAAAEVTQCMSNMRQVAQATIIYQSEQGCFPPAVQLWSGAAGTLQPSVNNAQGPCLWGLLTAIPQHSNARICPTVASLLLAPDPNLSPSTWPNGTNACGVFSYVYSGLISGADFTGMTASPQPFGSLYHYPRTDGVNWYPQPMKTVAHASETMMYIDYPQMRVFSELDGRSFQGPPPYGYTRATWAPFFQSDGHQALGDVCPTHGMKPANGVKFPTIGTAAPNIAVAMTGSINVAYCDGHVETLPVTQGQYNNGAYGDIQNSGAKGGYTLVGNNCYLQGTRYDPDFAP
jgi:prepilin-type N-terminal cleavage/methylation domain-containing protein/prepilin-type processing-associated H-X9-DG protein